MMRILVTGADGFVGRRLCDLLQTESCDVVRVVRTARDAGSVAVGDIAAVRNWTTLLQGVSAIVHVAARAHVLRETSAQPLDEFRRTNVAATVQLAEAAAAADVRRFVFLSSIGVNGTESGARAFLETDLPVPSEPYAVSKWEAEQALLDIGARTGMQVVRVRPPLVIGAGAKGNLLRLMRLVERGLPLPLGAIRNARSFVALADLCDLLSSCIRAERAADELFLAADAEELSTPQLMKEIAAGLGRKLRLVPVPGPALRLVARMTGLQSQLNRMAGSLRVDASKARRVLGWQPRVGLHSAIGSMAAAYLRERRG